MNTNKELDWISDFFKFCKIVFKPNRFFRYLYGVFVFFNLIFFSILMPLSNNDLSIMLIIFIILIGTVAPLQWILIKYYYPWKKKSVHKYYPNFFKDFNNFLKGIDSSDNFKQKCLTWKKRAKIQKFSQQIEIWISLLLLLIYVPLVLIFDMNVFDRIINRGQSNYNDIILTPLFLYIILPLYLIIIIIIFIFSFLEMYANRIRWLIEEIIQFHYNELIISKDSIISYSTRAFEDKEDIIKKINGELNHIMKIHSYEILGMMRSPEYQFNLHSLYKDINLVEILKDYETFLISMKNSETDQNLITKINHIMEYLQNIKSRLIREKQSIKNLILTGEGDKIEFKLSLWYDKFTKSKNRELEHEIIKTIAGFLNFKGGTLLIGVEDNGIIRGLENDYKLMGKKQNRDGFLLTLENIIDNNFKKNINAYLEKNIELVDYKEICIVTVKKSNVPIFLKSGEFYIRTSARTVKLTPEEAVKYIKDRF